MNVLKSLAFGLILATLCPACTSDGPEVDSGMVEDGTFQVKSIELKKCPNELYSKLNPCDTEDGVEYCAGGTITISGGIVDLSGITITSEGVDLILEFSMSDALPDYNSINGQPVSAFTWREEGSQEVSLEKDGSGCRSKITIK